jgi:putative selenium metabolism protein SsnA
LKHATMITPFPTKIEQQDLRIADGKIVEKAHGLEGRDGETVLDLSGKLLMPGMVCGHTHCYSALARGMPGPAEPPANFPEILEKVWWRLDRALDAEMIYSSTVVGVLDALASGTTTIIDHHASPNCIPGSLRMMKDVFEDVGVRGILCYEVTDRGGWERRDQGIAENRWLLEHQSDLVKGLVGAHAAFTLSDESLRLCAELMRAFECGLHMHLAEGVCDGEISRQRHGKGLVERLRALGVCTPQSLLIHGVHLTADEIRQIEDLGCWLVHNPRSNMNNGVGYAPIGQFGARVALGTDGITANMFEEAKFLYFKAQDAGVGVGAEECLRFLAGGFGIAREVFGQPFGVFESGAAADLIVLDYPAPTPLHEENLAWHLIFGMTHAHVESVMVKGKFLVQERRFVDCDVAALYRHAQRSAVRLWERMHSVEDA